MRNLTKSTESEMWLHYISLLSVLGPYILYIYALHFSPRWPSRGRESSLQLHCIYTTVYLLSCWLLLLFSWVPNCRDLWLRIVCFTKLHSKCWAQDGDKGQTCCPTDRSNCFTDELWDKKFLFQHVFTPQSFSCVTTAASATSQDGNRNAFS